MNRFDQDLGFKTIYELGNTSSAKWIFKKQLIFFWLRLPNSL